MSLLPEYDQSVDQRFIDEHYWPGWRPFEQRTELIKQCADRVEDLTLAVASLTQEDRAELQDLGVAGVGVGLAQWACLRLKDSKFVSPDMYVIRLQFASEEQRDWAEDRVEEIFENLETELLTTDEPALFFG